MESSGFFDSKLVNGSYDREYLVSQFARYFARFIGNGVFANIDSSSLLVMSEESGMNVTMKSGSAWINGYWYENEGDLKKSIDVSDSMYGRIDLVVLRFDIETREIAMKILKGVTSSSPQEPTYYRNSDYYDLVVAKIKIPAGATKIMQSYITDTRLIKPYCGAVVALVEQIDTTSYGSQLNKFINEYMVKVDNDYKGLYEQCQQWVLDIESAFTDTEVAEIIAKVNEVLIFNPYTYIVENDQNLTDWANNVTGNDYTSVLIKTGKHALMAPIDLGATGTKMIVGEPGNLIESNLSGTSDASKKLFYYTGNEEDAPQIDGVHMFSSSSYYTMFYGFKSVRNCSGKGINSQGTCSFDNCKNLYNCKTTYNKAAYSNCKSLVLCESDNGQFYKDEHLVNCKGAATASNGATNAVFMQCKNLTNCNATGIQTGTGSVHGYDMCDALVSCTYEGSITGYVSCTNNFNEMMSTLQTDINKRNVAVDRWDSTNQILYLKSV